MAPFVGFGDVIPMEPGVGWEISVLVGGGAAFGRVDWV